jgi:hypothetical protein
MRLAASGTKLLSVKMICIASALIASIASSTRWTYAAVMREGMA